MLFLAFAALCSALTVHAHVFPSSRHADENTVADNKPWDYLLFVQRWPQSVCDTMKSDECVIPSNISDWVVHGLWPNYNDGKWPQFCDQDDKFDVSKVEQFRARLEHTWPNLERGKTEESLWAHEWEKHGTCAKTLAALGDEQKYFAQSLDLLDNYHVGKALAKNNILPSNEKSYTKAQIEEALRANLGDGKDLFDLACARGELPHGDGISDGHRKKGKKAQLVEARACFDKQLALISCPQPHSAAEDSSHPQRVKRAVFDIISWFTTSNLPVTLHNNDFVRRKPSAGDDECPADEIYIPVSGK